MKTKISLTILLTLMLTFGLQTIGFAQAENPEPGPRPPQRPRFIRLAGEVTDIDATAGILQITDRKGDRFVLQLVERTRIVGFVDSIEKINLGYRIFALARMSSRFFRIAPAQEQ